MRPITATPVRSARNLERISISSLRDFATGARVKLKPEAATRERPLPYCLDLLGRRAIYVTGADPREAQAASFYYLYLRRAARGVISVPWEQGALARGEARAPIFLFSPGRCGSTLLSRILFAGGVANVSEPDFYTQATSAAAASPFNPFRTRMKAAIAAMGADLAAALDPAQPPVVKLRAESCRAPDLLVAPAERRSLFLTRGFEAWARSNGRAFRNPAAKSVNKYLRALRCYAWLRANTDCHLVHYEDLLAGPAGTVDALARFLARDIPAGAVASTMKEDSQDGTPVARGARSDRPGWERRFDETMALWNSARVREVRDRLGVAELRTG